MSKSPPPSVRSATLHTVIIGGAADMWSKLAWDADVCRDLQVSYPNERQPLAYAAINVCIAAQSLRDWVESELEGQAKAAGARFDETAHRKAMHTAVPEQAMCEAIANTAKHANYRDGRWPGGRVSLDWQEGDEDCPPGYMLHHIHGGSQRGALAVNGFEALCGNWWTFLRALGLAQGMSRTPEWQQNKLRRIFGDPRGRILPPDCRPVE